MTVAIKDRALRVGDVVKSPHRRIAASPHRCKGNTTMYNVLQFYRLALKKIVSNKQYIVITQKEWFVMFCFLAAAVAVYLAFVNN